MHDSSFASNPQTCSVAAVTGPTHASLPETPSGLASGVHSLCVQVMDFGYPQFTEAKILSEFIKTDAYKMEVQARPPMAVTNAVSWRSEGIKYKKNEVGSISFTPLSLHFWGLGCQ